MSGADRAVLEDVRAVTRTALEGAIGHGVDVAVLDCPNQRNVGDSMIWAGELAYFRALGLRIRYASDRQSFDPAALRKAMPRGVVLIHGGGNFGDLWYTHEQHREQIAAELTEYRVVQLPQSVFFSSDEHAATANAVLSGHPDFRVLLRDHRSIDRAAQQLPDVATEFCPDMALGWSPTARAPRGGDRAPLLVLARNDVESASGLHEVSFAGLPTAVEMTDWSNDGLRGAVWTRARYVPRIAHRVPAARGVAFQPAVKAALRVINGLNVRGGEILFSGREGAIVDRLHAHVLALLLGLDHVLLDNNYGKLRAVYDDYTHRFSTVHRADNVDDALAIAATFGGRG